VSYDIAKSVVADCPNGSAKLLKAMIDFVYPVCSLIVASAGAIYDVRSQRVPNAITFPAILFGLLLHFTFGGWRQVGSAAAGGLICGLIFLLFYLAGGMGAGDVKLIAATGCIAGLSLIGPLLLLTSLAGGLMAIALALYRGRLRETVANMGVLVIHHGSEGLSPHTVLNVDNARTLRLPYALAIATGSALSLCWMIVAR
jgi:prepilin peptidase CpaA